MIPCKDCQHSCLTIYDEKLNPPQVRKCYGWYEVDVKTNRDGSHTVADNSTCPRAKLRQPPKERAAVKDPYRKEK